MLASSCAIQCSCSNSPSPLLSSPPLPPPPSLLVPGGQHVGAFRCSCWLGAVEVSKVREMPEVLMCMICFLMVEEELCAFLSYVRQTSSTSLFPYDQWDCKASLPLFSPCSPPAPPLPLPCSSPAPPPPLPESMRPFCLLSMKLFISTGTSSPSSLT